MYRKPEGPKRIAATRCEKQNKQTNKQTKKQQQQQNKTKQKPQRVEAISDFIFSNALQQSCVLIG